MNQTVKTLALSGLRSRYPYESPDKELYPDLFTKTAALMDSLVRNHPFVDSNKRTAITTAGIFFRINRYQLKVESREMVRFTLACAQSHLSLYEMTDWFKQSRSPD